MEKVSIIIPTYNRSESVTRSIDSVLKQTYKNFELLVVDDASTDDTKEVIGQYDDDRLRYLRHEVNQGGSAARNTGIEAADGEYIAFLDSDDEWFPEKLQAQLTYLKSLPEDWSAVYCDFERSRSGPLSSLRRLLNGSSKDYAGREGGEELIKFIILKRFRIASGSTLMVRSSTVADLNGYDETFQRHQDWEFLIRLLQQGKLGYVDGKLVKIHGSGSPSPHDLEESKAKFFNKFSDIIEPYERQNYKIHSRHMIELARCYYQRGYFIKGTKSIPTELVFDPIGYLGLVWGALTGIMHHLKKHMGNI